MHFAMIVPPEWRDALVEGVWGAGVHVGDGHGHLVPPPGEHRALQLPVGALRTLGAAHGQAAVGAGEPVLGELTQSLWCFLTITDLTSLKQERQTGGVSWLGPTDTASSLQKPVSTNLANVSCVECRHLNMSSPGWMSLVATAHLPTPSSLVMVKGRQRPASSCRDWCWAEQKLGTK